MLSPKLLRNCILAAAAIALSGCINLSPTPSFGRNGDVININADVKIGQETPNPKTRLTKLKY